jgi:uracil-DNA glycosylase family 4
VTRREDILEELGLNPLWLHRSRLERAPVTAAPTAQRSHGEQRAEVATGHRPEEIANAGRSDRESRIREMDWPQLRQSAAHCEACVLHERRKQAVLGVGDERADWLIVGEGPGAEEDARGEPFVGQAGKLLDNMLAAIGLARGDNVYIANVVKCRPPGNRTPTPEEAAACAPYLDRQIDLIEPRLIIALGKVAAHRLLGRDATLASLRKTVHRYRDIPLVVTYHPAYLLRNLTDKAKAWEDLRFAIDTMSGLPDTTRARK